MIRKCLYDGNDDNDNGGDDDDVKRYFYKFFKGIRIELEVTKVQEHFKKAFGYKL